MVTNIIKNNLIAALLYFSSNTLQAQVPYPTDAPHWGSGIDCISCHQPHRNSEIKLTNLSGNANLCMSCHNEGGIANNNSFAEADKALPGISGTSHAWDIQVINPNHATLLPLNPELAQRIPDGYILCSTCHDPHVQKFPPFLRISNQSDALCKDCHRIRNIGRYTDSKMNKGSHPVGIEYPAADGRFRRKTVLSLPLSEANRVECTTCHSVHNANSGGANEGTGDGNLLRMKNDASLCKSCHVYQDHMGTTCLVCHQTHARNKQNIYMVNNSVPITESEIRPVIFTALTGENSFADNENEVDGICEVCHTKTTYFRNDGTGVHDHHYGENCTSCHNHADGFMPKGRKHENSWLILVSPGFHGRFIRESGWDLQQCMPCHGTDYNGGLVEVSCMGCHPSSPEGCTTCHGGKENRTGAPPKDIDNNLSTAATGVGAHTAHLTEGELSSGFSCKICHIVPDSLHTTDHVDTELPAEVSFNGLAKQEDAAPEWDGTTCQNSYCHGNFTLGNRTNSPQWTRVDGTQDACGTCHALPPASPHPSNTRCYICHGDVVDANKNIIDKNLHINGETNVKGQHPTGWMSTSSANFHGIFIRVSSWNLKQCQDCHGDDYSGGLVGSSCLSCHPSSPEGCTVCHGGMDNNSGAPPEDIDGNHLTSARGIGAHTAHLSTGKLSTGFACETCHTVPGTFDVAGHVDSDLPAEIHFGGLARQEGANPTWDGTTCQNSYCHGNFTMGDQTNDPTWTISDGTQAACGTCHSLPPQGRHSKNDRCHLCHSDVVSSTNKIINNVLHINGKADVRSRDCLSCHNQTPAFTTVEEGVNSIPKTD
ncbi:MAG: CxxxxCH/CxxCH domain-containing protein [Deferribacteres bacterium]|nr:CxxxxCH/CxxCH domain-containing protein [candidate division KSB1 bacterium]MCB9500886.1 CxxxxCH/CxxCH domain-containing protein [Deferribacteres bacterium]